MAISLDSIKSGKRIKAPKIVIIGPGCIGKTTFASNAPDPIFLCTEEGQGLLDIHRFELRERDPVLQSWDEIIECLEALHTQDHDHKTVVLDSIDFAEPLLWSHVSKKWGEADIESFGYGKGYVKALDEARVLLQWLDALRNDKGMAIVIIGHSCVKKVEPPDMESYHRYTLNVNKGLVDLIHDWSDAFLFANYLTAVVEDKDGTGKHAKKRRRGVGTGDRVLYTQDLPSRKAKNRYSLPPELPLDWQALQDAIAESASK